MKNPTIVEIARAVGVSLGTVSNVLNGKSTVKEETVRRVQAAAVKLGYQRNFNAASLRSNQTDMVALIVPNIENAFFAEFVSVIEHLAEGQSKGVLFMATGEDKERVKRQIQNIVSRRVDGLIVIPSFDFQPLIGELAAYRIPVVLADRVEKENLFPSVATDNFQAGYLGGQHLFSCGYRSVAFFSHGSDRWVLEQRKEGFIQAAKEARVLTHCRFHDVGLSPEEIRLSTVKLLEEYRRPQAIFAASNIATKGLIPALQQAHLKIPDEVALLVVDDFEALGLLHPPVSVVDQPVADIARSAWSMLQTLIDGKKLKDKHPRLAPQLIVRGSTGAGSGKQEGRAPAASRGIR